MQHGWSRTLGETSVYKDFGLGKADILQRNHTTLQPAQVSSAERILREKKARIEHASLPSSWDKADRTIIKFPTDYNYQVSNRYGTFTGNFSFSKFNNSQGNNLSRHPSPQPAALCGLPEASPTSGEMPLEIVAHKRQHKHLTTPSPEKCEAPLSYCGASTSNTHFLSSLLT